MDQPTTTQPVRSTGIPRLSRLPIPKSYQSNANTLHTIPSSDSLRTRSIQSPAPVSVRKTSSVQNFRASTITRPTSQTSRPHAVSSTRSTTSNFITQRTLNSRPPSTSSRQPSTRDYNVNEVRNTCSSRPVSSASSRAHAVTNNDDGDQQDVASREGNRKSRLSLAERTIESIAKVPPSPANGRRRSSFFQQQPRATSSRPTSAFGSRSRAGSQDEVPAIPYPLPTRSVVAGRVAESPATPVITKRSFSASMRPKASSTLAKTSSPIKSSKATAIWSSKTVAGRPTKSVRPALAGLFNPPNTQVEEGNVPKISSLSVKKPTAQSKSPKAAAAANSSSALREQIKAARAAKQSLLKNPAAATQSKSLPKSGFDFLDNDDPFNQRPQDGSNAIKRKVDSARADGRLNISCMGLKEVPEEVLKIYDSEFNTASPISWNEAVDLVRFIAADNEFETIPDNVFPDVDMNAFALDHDIENLQFGGIELLDFHGNLLSNLPVGLRRLERLTSLNLARNRLTNCSLDIISQISCLKELRIFENALTGELSSCICNLKELEVLEIQGNKLTNLPVEVSSLDRLRILNVSNNQLTSLPMIALNQLALTSLDASKNHLAGALFADEATTMDKLVSLDVSANWLTSFSTGLVALPKLQNLNFSYNRISELPSMVSWKSLITLQAEDNKLSSLPEGLTNSSTLQTVDFTGNDFSKLDPRLGTMIKLHSFKIAANPIRERKFLTMSTEALKRDLKARLGMDEPGTEID